MINIVITSFKEPITIGKAIESFLNQNYGGKYEIIVSAPDEETLRVADEYKRSNKNIKIVQDPGKGKSYAINWLLPKLKGEIIILSDGDVFVKPNSIKHIIEKFDDERVGCVTGRPVSINKKNNLLGYWSHLLVDGMHKFRMNRAKRGEFLECSGYLWAFRNNVIRKFPVDIAEDTVVPYLFREKGYKIGYAHKAEVYVKYPEIFKEFINQKKRTAKSHESLDRYVNIKKLPRTKSFKNEIIEGTFEALLHPRGVREIIYALLLFPVRLYIWILVFWHTKVKNKHYEDAWERVESTK